MTAATRLRCLEKALEIAGLDRLRGAQGGVEGARQAARHRACTYIEACGLAPSRIAGRLGARGGMFESATVRVHPTGDVTVLIGTHNHGQGHETTYAQIVSEKLGIPTDNIEIVFGDTDKVQFGLGTYGSRSLAVGGTGAARRQPTRSSPRASKIAAHMLEAQSRTTSSSRRYRSASRAPTGPRRFGEVAGAAYGLVNYPLEVLSRGSRNRHSTIRSNFTYPGGAHICRGRDRSGDGRRSIWSSLYRGGRYRHA